MASFWVSYYGPRANNILCLRSAIGHKEFHTVSLHLSQILYIWPYFFFFSWPILVIPLFNLIAPDGYIPAVFRYGFPKKQRGFPRLWTAVVAIPIMLAIVHFNTIVHPFTLADNRHYVFYVFRILLRLHPAVKYISVLVYFVCAWAVISAFGFTTSAPPSRLVQAPVPPPQQKNSSGIRPQQQQGTMMEKKNRNKNKRNKQNISNNNKPDTMQKPTNTPPPPPISPEAFAAIQAHIVQRQRDQLVPPRVSFVLVWLVSTTLSLVTAPLVEPRYFIIPWVIWRLHLPPQPMPLVYRQPQWEISITCAKLAQNLPLFMETLWFLVVNAVTCYVFLYKGFEWQQEPGKVQRFLW